KRTGLQLGGRPGWSWQAGLKHFRFQTSDLADGLGDAGQRLQRQMSAAGIGRGPVRGVDLHERNLRSALLQFLQTKRELFNLLGRRFLAIDGREETLNDDRPLSRQ